jgi:hypothetical protein
MIATVVPAIGPLELAGALLSWPPFSLVIATVITAAIAAVVLRRPLGNPRASVEALRPVRDRYAPEHRAVGFFAMVTVVSFVAVSAIGSQVLDLGSWPVRFAVPLLSAAVGVGVVLALIITRRSASSRAPVVPAVRRSWSSFSSRSSLVVATVALLTLVGTTVAAGSASSPNHQGHFVWLAIPIPNEASIDPIRLPFFGWAYGVPVLLALAALIAVAWTALSRNAARPFLGPETVTAERAARHTTAGGITLVLTSAVLLSLSGAWRLIANGGSIDSLVVMGENDDAPYDAAWRYAELAVAAGWAAPIMEITALTILLLVAVTRMRGQRFTRAHASSSAPARSDVEVGP